MFLAFNELTIYYMKQIKNRQFLQAVITDQT